MGMNINLKHCLKECKGHRIISEHMKLTLCCSCAVMLLN
uniref:Uncharacterized protein n=1 Tax=Anguilla anguilla TaxID=7936 RepID=A0A0E9RMX9_ANGAN